MKTTFNHLANHTLCWDGNIVVPALAALHIVRTKPDILTSSGKGTYCIVLKPTYGSLPDGGGPSEDV